MVCAATQRGPLSPGYGIAISMVQEHPEEPASENKCRGPNLWRKTRDHNREKRGFGDRRTLQKEIRCGRRQEILLKAGCGGSASSSVRVHCFDPRATLGTEVAVGNPSAGSVLPILPNQFNLFLRGRLNGVLPLEVFGLRKISCDF